jgi:hypothetical protein
MNHLRQILIDRLRAHGIADGHLTFYLKSLEMLIDSEPGIGPVQLTRKLHALGWDEISWDYHYFQIALACFDKNKSRNAPS